MSHALQPFSLADVTVDPVRLALFRNGKMLDIPEHYVAVLIRLAEEPQKTVRRDELIKAMGEGEVSEDVLNKAIQEIRGILGGETIRTERTHGYRLMNIPEKKEPRNAGDHAEPQLTIWTTGRGGEPGIFINRRDGDFIPWSVLQEEMRWLLRRVERLPLGCTARPTSHRGIRNYFVQVFDSNDVVIPNVHVWFGIDPSNLWKFDGLVRIGWSDKPGSQAAQVWDVFQRYSDGAYRRVAGYG